MTEKRFIGYDFGEYENRNYAVYDLSKSEKTKEDFWDNEEECYDIWAFVDYLEENDCVLSCDEVVDLLNEQEATIRKLQDLCGESDSENAKLRIENKKLKEERQRLIYHLNKEPKR